MLDFYCEYKNALAFVVVFLSLSGSCDAVYQYRTDTQRAGGHRTAANVLVISVLLLMLHNCPKEELLPEKLPLVPIEKISRCLLFVGCLSGLSSLLLALYGRRIAHLWRVLSDCR